jgi:hypothetical protein
MKKMKWKSMGVKWDGHCWMNVVTSDGFYGTKCMDCGKRVAFTAEEMKEEDY